MELSSPGTLHLNKLDRHENEFEITICLDFSVHILHKYAMQAGA